MGRETLVCLLITDSMDDTEVSKGIGSGAMLTFDVTGVGEQAIGAPRVTVIQASFVKSSGG